MNNEFQFGGVLHAQNRVDAGTTIDLIPIVEVGLLLRAITKEFNINDPDWDHLYTVYKIRSRNSAVEYLLPRIITI